MASRKRLIRAAKGWAAASGIQSKLKYDFQPCYKDGSIFVSSYLTTTIFNLPQGYKLMLHYDNRNGIVYSPFIRILGPDILGPDCKECGASEFLTYHYHIIMTSGHGEYIKNSTPHEIMEYIESLA